MLYADGTDQVKLQITKTISLALTAPVEFAQFQQTGEMAFATPQALFDRDFPGHYLRLISQVSVSVVALIPPNQGISASLASDSISRVVVNTGSDFQTVTIRRDPQYVALSSPTNATGLFNLQAQSTDLLLPFEDNGVDAVWQFRMDLASNPFDFGSITDIVVSISYTALNSTDYRSRVIRQLDGNIGGDRPYSFRNQFQDQWYELNNPDQSSTPMTVQFSTFAADFPANLSSLQIQQVVLYFSRTTDTFEVPVSTLRFKEKGSGGYVGGAGTSSQGVLSTRRGNAGSWGSMIGKSPVGVWELSLSDTDAIRAHFTSGLSPTSCS